MLRRFRIAAALVAALAAAGAHAGAYEDFFVATLRDDAGTVRRLVELGLAKGKAR